MLAVEIIISFFNIVCKFASSFPQFENEKDRLSTYTDKYPRHRHPKPEILATAGFFYKSFDDATQCYMCGKILVEWEENDSPWDEHQRLSPECKHVLRQQYRNGLIDDAEARGFLEEAKIIIQKLYHYCTEANTPFKFAVQLGHEKNTIANLLADKFFKNGLTMPPISTQSLIKELIDVKMKETEDQNVTLMPDLYDKIRELYFLYQQIGPINSFTVQTITNERNTRSKENESNGSTLIVRSHSTEETNRLKEDNAIMIVKTLCRICESARANVLHIPCGHIAACDTCDSKNNLIICSICTEQINESIRVYHT